MYFNTTSREEQLAEAIRKVELVEAYLLEIKALKARILESFPIRTYKLSKSKAEKALSWPNVVEHLERQQSYLNNLKLTIAHEEQQRKRKLLEQEAMKKQKNQENDKLTLALTWLKEHRPNLTYNLAYTDETAFNMAYELSIDDEIKNMKSVFDFISFQGNDDCTDECQGWDMTSSRCDCGSHRVSWNTELHSLTSPLIYASSC